MNNEIQNDSEYGAHFPVPVQKSLADERARSPHGCGGCAHADWIVTSIDHKKVELFKSKELDEIENYLKLPLPNRPLNSELKRRYAELNLQRKENLAEIERAKTEFIYFWSVGQCLAEIKLETRSTTVTSNTTNLAGLTPLAFCGAQNCRLPGSV